MQHNFHIWHSESYAMAVKLVSITAVLLPDKNKNITDV